MYGRDSKKHHMIRLMKDNDIREEANNPWAKEDALSSLVNDTNDLRAPFAYYRKREKDLAKIVAKDKYEMIQKGNRLLRERIEKNEKGNAVFYDENEEINPSVVLGRDEIISKSTPLQQSIKERVFRSFQENERKMINSGILEQENQKIHDLSHTGEGANYPYHYLVSHRSGLAKRNSRVVKTIEIRKEEETKEKMYSLKTNNKLTRKQKDMIEFKIGNGTEMSIENTVENQILLSLALDKDLSDMMIANKIRDYRRISKRINRGRKLIKKEEKLQRLMQMKNSFLDGFSDISLEKSNPNYLVEGDDKEIANDPKSEKEEIKEKGSDDSDYDSEEEQFWKKVEERISEFRKEKRKRVIRLDSIINIDGVEKMDDGKVNSKPNPMMKRLSKIVLPNQIHLDQLGQIGPSQKSTVRELLSDYNSREIRKMVEQRNMTIDIDSINNNKIDLDSPLSNKKMKKNSIDNNDESVFNVNGSHNPYTDRSHVLEKMKGFTQAALETLQKGRNSVIFSNRLTLKLPVLTHKTSIEGDLEDEHSHENMAKKERTIRLKKIEDYDKYKDIFEDVYVHNSHITKKLDNKQPRNPFFYENLIDYPQFIRNAEKEKKENDKKLRKHIEKEKQKMQEERAGKEDNRRNSIISPGNRDRNNGESTKQYIVSMNKSSVQNKTHDSTEHSFNKFMRNRRSPDINDIQMKNILNSISRQRNKSEDI